MANKLEVQIEANVAGLQRGLASAQQAVAAFRDQVSQQLSGASNATIPVRPVVDRAAAAEVQAEVEKLSEAASKSGASTVPPPINNAFTESLKDGESTFSRFADTVSALWKRIGEDMKAADWGAFTQGVRGLAAEYATLGNAALEAASELAAQRRQFTAAGFKGEGLEEAAEMLDNLRLNSKLSEGEIASAIVTFKKFGVVSKESLQTAANLAAGTGQSIQTTAQLLGLLSRGGEDTSRAVMMLSRTFNITGKDLAQFGAEVDDSGKVLTKTKDQAEKARGAIEKFVAVNYGDAAKSLQSATDEMEAHLDNLLENTGKAAASMKGSLIRGFLIPLIDYIDTQVPDGAKGIVGLFGAATSELISFGAKAAEVGADVKILFNGLGLGEVKKKETTGVSSVPAAEAEAAASDLVTAAQERQAAATEQTVGTKQQLAAAHEEVAGAAQAEVAATTETAGAHEAAAVVAGEHALAEEAVVVAEEGAVVGAEAEIAANTELVASHEAATAAALEHAGAEEAAAGAAGTAGAAGAAGAGAAGAGAAGAAGAGAAANVGKMGILTGAGGTASIGSLLGFGFGLGAVGLVGGLVAGQAIENATGRTHAREELADKNKHSKALLEDMDKHVENASMANLDDWAGKSGEQLVRMGVSFKQVADAAKFYADKIGLVAQNDSLSSEEKQKQIAALRAQQQALSNAAGSMREYHEAAQQSLDQAHTATAKAQADVAAGVGLQSEVISRLRDEAEATDRDTAGDDTEEAKQKRIAAWQAYYAAVNQMRQDNLKAEEDASSKSAEAASLEVEHRKQLVEEHKRDGSVTLADRKAVIDAEVEAERRAYEAKKQSLQNQLEAERASGKARPAEIAAINKAIQNLDVEHTNKLRGIRDQRLQDEQEEADRGLAIQRHRYDEYLTVVEDYQADLNRRREHGEDVSGQDKQAIANAYQDQVNKENAEFQRQIANKKKGTAEYEDAVRAHEARLEHLRADRVAKEDAADKRAAAARAENINAEKDLAVAEQTRVNTQIQKLEDLRAKGQSVEAEMAAAIEHEADLRDTIIQKTREAALETERNEKKRQAINAKADADLEASQQKRQRDLEQNHKAELQRQEQLAGKRRSVLDSEHTSLEQRIKREQEQGQSTEDDYRKRYDLEVRMAQQEYQAAMAAAEKLDGEEKTLAVQKAALDYQNAQGDAAQKLKDALKEAQQAMQGMSSSPLQSLEEAFGSGSGSMSLGNFRLGKFGLGATNTPATPSALPSAPVFGAGAPIPTGAVVTPPSLPSPKPTSGTSGGALGGSMDQAHVVVTVNGKPVHELKVEAQKASPNPRGVDERQNLYYQSQTQP